jgi:tRNA dimethylallyltransferase
VAIAVAEHTGGEIVSVDSMQVYRGMDIGTAKPDAAMCQRVPHHLLDLAEPAHDMTVAEFQQVGRTLLADLEARETPAIVAGGSGMHFRSLVDPMTFAPSEPALRKALEASPLEELVAELLAADPNAVAHVDADNPRRVIRAVEVFRLTGATPSQRTGSDEYRALRNYRPERPFRAVGLDPGERLEARVIERFDAMLAAGLLEEVRSLAPQLGRTARQAVGYKELLPVVAGDASLAEGRQVAISGTLGLAKRQRTYFRRDPRIRWLPWQDDPADRIAAVIEAFEEPTWTS